MLCRGLEFFASHLALRKRRLFITRPGLQECHFIVWYKYCTLYCSYGKTRIQHRTLHCVGWTVRHGESHSADFSLLVFVSVAHRKESWLGLLVSLNSGLGLLYYMKSESSTVCKTSEEFSLQGYNSGFSSSYSSSLVCSSWQTLNGATEMQSVLDEVRNSLSLAADLPLLWQRLRFDTASNSSRFSQRRRRRRRIIIFSFLQEWSGNLYEPPEQSGCWCGWKKRGNVGDGRAASWHRSALCAAAWTYANVSYANEAPPRPSVVKGRHSITQSRSGGELASLHLSGSDGPSSGYQGDVRG